MSHFFWNISTAYRQSSVFSLHATGSKPPSQHPLGQSFLFEFLVFVFVVLHSSWISSFLGFAEGRSEEEVVYGLHQPNGWNCVWKPAVPWHFTVQGQLPLPELTLLLPHSSHCPHSPCPPKSYSRGEGNVPSQNPQLPSRAAQMEPRLGCRPRRAPRNKASLSQSFLRTWYCLSGVPVNITFALLLTNWACHCEKLRDTNL